MLLAEADRYLLAQDFARAFECFLRVKALSPRWAGLDEHVNRALFAEGSDALLNGEGEHGLRLLRELHARRPDYPGLADKLATSYGARINHAFDLGQYRSGRRILHELEPLAPDHEIVRDARGRFIGLARQWVEKAGKREGFDRLDALTEALRVWPALEGAGRALRRGVRGPRRRSTSPWWTCRGRSGPGSARRPTSASRDSSSCRCSPATTRTAMQGKLPGQLASGLETADLGRKLVIRLRRG